ncbi:hypothetical protein [Chryseobacterium sp.]|uniref:hypothetical protein n=1 Tax=Chryseobacterium sp. TaxID=1871047 RepID=UPI0032199382
MYISGSHYSGINNGSFPELMKRLAAQLPKYREKYGVDAWFVTGKSGIVAQAALIMLGSEQPVCAVRKPGESSHGSMFEGNCNHMGRKPYLHVGIIDDFVDSGATVTRILGQIAEARRWTANEYVNASFELRCVVGYKKDHPDRSNQPFWVPEHFVQDEAVEGRSVTVPYIGV